MTKEKFTGKMRYFWTNHWWYMTIDDWVEWTKAKLDYDKKDGSMYRSISNDLNIAKASDLINGALDKLVLEKLLKKDQVRRIRELLKSPDEENHYLAISIMASVKPKKFKQVITQNPETNDKDS